MKIDEIRKKGLIPLGSLFKNIFGKCRLYNDFNKGNIHRRIKMMGIYKDDISDINIKLLENALIHYNLKLIKHNEWEFNVFTKKYTSYVFYLR